ncbi:hypothetical protein AAG906_003703 [Vitis piasezkii]
MTLIEASLFLTSSLKELGNINNQTPLWYMPTFFLQFGCCWSLWLCTSRQSHTRGPCISGEKDMPWHGVDHVLDTPDCNATPYFELQPSGPIHVQSDGEEEDEPDVMSLSVFIIPLRNKSICMFNGSPLVQVFLPVPIKNHWTLYLYDLHSKRIHLLNSRLDRKKTTMIGIQQNLVK